MNKGILALAVALSGINAAQAGEFDGVWLGARLGYNQSDLSGWDKQGATAFGLAGGYNWNVESFLLGVDGFADLNGKAAHNPGPVNYGSRALGFDGKIGVPMGDWLPYAKLGYVRTSGNGDARQISGGGAHLGLGAEYKFTPELSVSGEYARANATSGVTRLNNDNFMLGLNYYFDTNNIPYAPQIAPVAKRELPKVPIEVPVVKEESKVVVKEQPKEVWKTLLEDKPVTFTGVNFDTKSAKLLPAADTRLDEVAEFAKLYPDAQLQIAGHTDFRAGKSKKAYNQKLSMRRAAAFKGALVKKGVAAERISTQGFGFEQPVADNNTEEGRAQNRRVEIRSGIREEKKVRVTE
ncbi:MAG: OmpA family protein [Proteobacteria bacterium]|nr:OmpA family protein [Pseudomonadota bacterium]